MDFSDNVLILMMGLPRSGKSTMAREINKKHGYPIVNPDSFRLEIHGAPFFRPAEALVWYMVEITIRSLFRAGHSHVILDATNVSRKRRDKWKDLGCRVHVCGLNVSKGVCVERAEEGGREDLVSVIERMAGEMESIGDDENLYHPDGIIIDCVILKPGETFDEGCDRLAEEKGETPE
jgi:predicted kinase